MIKIHVCSELAKKTVSSAHTLGPHDETTAIPSYCILVSFREEKPLFFA